MPFHGTQKSARIDGGLRRKYRWWCSQTASSGWEMWRFGQKGPNMPCLSTFAKMWTETSLSQNISDEVIFQKILKTLNLQKASKSIIHRWDVNLRLKVSVVCLRKSWKQIILLLWSSHCLHIPGGMMAWCLIASTLWTLAPKLWSLRLNVSEKTSTRPWRAASKMSCWHIFHLWMIRFGTVRDNVNFRKKTAVVVGISSETPFAWTWIASGVFGSHLFHRHHHPGILRVRIY